MVAIHVLVAALAALVYLLVRLWRRRRAVTHASFICSVDKGLEEGLLSGQTADLPNALLITATTKPIPKAVSMGDSQAIDAVRAARLREVFDLFSLPVDQVAASLKSLGAVVAGGSMVHAYLPSLGPVAAFKGDLDIFTPFNTLPAWQRLGMSGGATGQYAVLGASGEEGQSASAAQYKAGLARKAGAGNHSAYNTLKPTIISVHDFMHPGTGRVVQIITMQDAKNAVDHFDLSAAATWFDGDMLRTKYPATTDKGQMFWMHEDPRMGPRHDKYVSKGFTLVDRPKFL